MSERHPLDPDDDEIVASIREPPGVSRINLPLLRASVKVVIFSFIVCFVAGIAAFNAGPNTPLEAVASFVHRLGMFVLLIAFCAILAAYRMPRVRQLRYATGKLGNEIQGQRTRDAMSKTHSVEFGFESLVVLNVVGVFMVWVALILGSAVFGNGVFVAVVFLSALYAGLLSTMALLHKGFLQAYAVSALTAILLQSFSGVSSFWFAIGGTRQSSGGSLVVLLACLQVALAPSVGLVSAIYACWLERIRKPSSDVRDDRIESD